MGVDDLGTSSPSRCVSFSTGGTTLCAPVSNGIATFTNATLQPGSSLLTAAATDQAGNSSSVPFAVSLDADFPAIQITAPFDGSVVATSTVDIAVTIGDSEGPRSPCSSGVATKWSADSSRPRPEFSWKLCVLRNHPGAGSQYLCRRGCKWRSQWCFQPSNCDVQG